MSDYEGSPTLESWLSEEIFYVKTVPHSVVVRFEKWREGVEQDISNWMDSDDGYGNNLSWRGWGRGFNGVPEEDDEEFGAAIRFGKNEIKRL